MSSLHPAASARHDPVSQQSSASPYRVPCRNAGCRHEEVQLGLCFRCLGRYRSESRRRGERVEEIASALRAAVDERLLGLSGTLRHAMAINLAAHLVAVEDPLTDEAGLW